MSAGYSLDTNSTSGADAFTQGGSAGGGTGAMNYNVPASGIPVWAVVAAAAAALFAFFSWRRKK